MKEEIKEGTRSIPPLRLIPTKANETMNEDDLDPVDQIVQQQDPVPDQDDPSPSNPDFQTTSTTNNEVTAQVELSFPTQQLT